MSEEIEKPKATKLIKSCATCRNWGGHEFPPVYAKAYCEVLDRDTPGYHGSECNAYEQVEVDNGEYEAQLAEDIASEIQERMAAIHRSPR